jgi:hypothetical protein
MNAHRSIPVRISDPFEHIDALDDAVDEFMKPSVDGLFRRDPRRPAYCHAFKIRSQRPGYAPDSDGPAYASRADAEADCEAYRRQWRGKPCAPSYEVIEVYTTMQGLVRGTRAAPLFGVKQ